MVRFLHIADVHLGTNQYNSPENTRKKDFFYAFQSVIEKYALAENVDFVIIAGDLFDKNRLDPNTLNQAIVVFSALKEKNIPVFVIEGNHDSIWGDGSVSWLQFLGEHGYINFLKPERQDNQIIFQNSSADNPLSGYYILNNQVRIIGSQWYGANTASAIPLLAEGIKQLGSYPYTILLMHAGLEGYLAGYGTITKTQLEPLRGLVNYIALGHIHKHYIYDNFAYNPGSLEACCIPEYFDEHGALLVEIDSEGKTKTKLLTNYIKREFIRINIDISHSKSAEIALELIKNSIKSTIIKNKNDKPVVEITIDGILNFRRAEINTEEIKLFALNELQALIVHVKYFARSKDYAIGVNLSSKNTRQEIELTVIKDMLAKYDAYKNKNETIAKAVTNLKEMVLNADSNENILKYLKEALDEN